MNIEMQFRAVNDPGLYELLRVSASLSDNGFSTDIPTMKTEVLSFTPSRQLSTESIRSLCSDEDYGTPWFEEPTELSFESKATYPTTPKIISDKQHNPQNFNPYKTVDRQVSSSDINNTPTIYSSPGRYDDIVEELVLTAPVPRPGSPSSTFKPARTINSCYKNPQLKLKVSESIDPQPLVSTSYLPLLCHDKYKENNKVDRKTVWEIVKDKNATMDTESLSISESALSADAEPFYPSRYSIL